MKAAVVPWTFAWLMAMVGASVNGQTLVPFSSPPVLLKAAPGSPLNVAEGVLAAGDVNGDRCDDLILATGTTLKVFFGSSKISWQKEPDVTGELPSKSSEIAVADVNRDAKLDLVLADHDSYSVAVLLGSGDGRFKAVSGSPFLAREGTQPHTHGLTVADVNGDGHQDIVTANNADGDISLLLGDGRGAFARAPKSPFPCGKSPYPIAAADINADGYADVLAPNATHGDQQVKTLAVLLGNSRGELKAAPNSPLQCEATVWYAAIGDLNGDRRPDAIAVHGEGNQGLSILLNDGQGRLSLAPTSPLNLGHGAWGAEIADMNRDGNADLVVAADDAIRLFLGNGHGAFAPAPGSPYQTGKGAWRLVVADFNGDGKKDVASRCVEANRIEILNGQ